jgi:hypothetical protein
MTKETTNEAENVRCPYCLELQSDSWELGDGEEGCGETECEDCGKEFRWAREISINYKGKPL